MPLDYAKIDRLVGPRGRSALARRMGIAARHLTRLLNGRGDPPLSSCERLARGLGVPLGELLTKEKQPAVPFVRPVKKSVDRAVSWKRGRNPVSRLAQRIRELRALKGKSEDSK